MPLYDFECGACGHIHEAVASIKKTRAKCPACGKTAKRIISVSGAYCSNEDAGWLKTVVDVVDKDGGAHCQEFIRNPTRANYRKWMQGEGLRPLEPGEKGIHRRESVDMDKVNREVMRKHMDRMSITVRQ